MIARWTGWDRLGHSGRVLQAGGIVAALALVCMAAVDKPLARYMHGRVSGDANAIWAEITRLGDATGYVVAALAVLAVSGAGRKVLAPSALRTRVINAGRYALLMLVALAVSGAIVNVAKPVLGRLRPEYLFESGRAGFVFWHFDFGANTFPSGHAQAIFAVATVLCLAWPRWRIALMTLAATVAASRVILSTHFLSDVLVGAYLGAASVLLLEPVILRRAAHAAGGGLGRWAALRQALAGLRLRRTRAGAQRGLIGVTAVAAVASVLWPGVDLALMRLLHSEAGGFALHSTAIGDTYDAVRTPVFRGIALAVIGLTLAAALGRPAPGFGWRRLGVIWATLVGVVGLLANVIFKNSFGRPRPEDVQAFGGELTFHPPWLPGGACPHNCSFPSGDVAYAAIVFAFALAVPPGRGRGAALVAATAFVAVVAAMRMLTGDHFPSDVVFGALLTVIAVLVLDARWVGVARVQPARHEPVTPREYPWY